jgi:dynein intermediate chain
MITTASFYPFSNNTIIGGCYNGQLLLWDIRTKSLPVQRTGLSSSGHKYPVYTLNVVGTQIANNIVSISNDGKLCIWDLKSFSSPTKSVKL